MPLNSAVYTQKNQRTNHSYRYYYENVLSKSNSSTGQNVNKLLKNYLSERDALERIFTLSADSVSIRFWKYNSRTRYFLEHKQDDNGDPGNTLRGEDYSDFLGKIICGPGKNTGEIDCLIFISSNDLKGTKVTDSMTIMKKNLSR